jgi:hypothetical protein
MIKADLALISSNNISCHSSTKKESLISDAISSLQVLMEFKKAIGSKMATLELLASNSI